MPKKLLKRISPTKEDLQNHKFLRAFGKLLHNPNLWHFNKHSISGAAALGIFCAFIPVPFQMVVAAAVAIYIHVNMPVAIAMVWISNPVTMAPMFYSCYLVGAWFLNTPTSEFAFELSWSWLATSLAEIWQPFLLGCFIVGAISAILGYISMRGLWRLAMVRKWQKRAKNRV
ncbi:MAG: DUF2062 domain-containing protein [Gammaproteobacteria bacterium]|nr:DUF2062 domain-containing protein [Gammaproteobacteria bacterium]NNJ73375.1 DUF2062 domain-containing protein [Enterobacterales bacterium]